MKKLLIGIALGICCVFIPAQSSSAHVLITDETKSKGAILHIIPDDDPIAGEESTLYFDTQEQLSDSGNMVNFSVKNGSDETQNVETKLEGSLATARYTFPTQGIYTLVFTVTASGNTYTFTQTQRVSRGVSTNALEKTTYGWAEVLIITSSVGFALLIILAINRREAIAKHSTF